MGSVLRGSLSLSLNMKRCQPSTCSGRGGAKRPPLACKVSQQLKKPQSLAVLKLLVAKLSASGPRLLAP